MKRKILLGSIILLLLLPTAIGAIAGNASEPLPEGPPDTWGVVLYANAATSYVEVGMPNYTWYGGILIGYKVLAIGRHSIHWVIEYDVYIRTLDGLERKTGSVDGNDSVYLFDMQKRPMFHPYVSNGIVVTGEAFYLFDHGEWWCKLYIDGELKKEVYGSAVHH